MVGIIRYWHRAEAAQAQEDVRFQGRSGHFAGSVVSLKMTRNGHPRDAALAYLLKHPNVRSVLKLSLGKRRGRSNREAFRAKVFGTERSDNNNFNSAILNKYRPGLAGSFWRDPNTQRAIH